MKVDNKNGIGNPYHNDNTGEFSSANGNNGSNNKNYEIGDRVFSHRPNESFYEYATNDEPNTVGNLSQKEYYKYVKGVDANVEYMSAKEVLNNMLQLWDELGGGRTKETFKLGADKKYIDKYAQDMLNGDKFPIPVVDFSDNHKFVEGRHRTYAFIKAFGEDAIMPVIIGKNPQVSDEEWNNYLEKRYGKEGSKRRFFDEPNPYNEKSQEQKEYEELYESKENNKNYEEIYEQGENDVEDVDLEKQKDPFETAMDRMPNCKDFYDENGNFDEDKYFQANEEWQNSLSYEEYVALYGDLDEILGKK